LRRSVARDRKGRTLSVSRPKIDRIACPWLIRCFVDPNAIFLFVIASEVINVAERFNATPFDSCFLEPSREDLHLRHVGRGVRTAD
jgi:hypothetical protein